MNIEGHAAVNVLQRWNGQMAQTTEILTSELKANCRSPLDDICFKGAGCVYPHGHRAVDDEGCGKEVRKNRQAVHLQYLLITELTEVS